MVRIQIKLTGFLDLLYPNWIEHCVCFARREANGLMNAALKIDYRALASTWRANVVSKGLL